MAAFDTLQDGFDDGALDTATRWKGSYGALREQGGRAGIQSGEGYPALRTPAAYTLTGSEVFARVHPAPAGTATSATSEMLVDNGAGTRLIIITNTATGTIEFRSDSGYGDANKTSIPYDPVGHAWWRFRETAGTVYMETSPDCVTWATRRQVPTPGWITDGTGDPLFFSTHRNTPDAGLWFEVDNVNVAPAPTGPTTSMLLPDGTWQNIRWERIT